MRPSAHLRAAMTERTATLILVRRMSWLTIKVGAYRPRDDRRGTSWRGFCGSGRRSALGT